MAFRQGADGEDDMGRVEPEEVAGGGEAEAGVGAGDEDGFVLEGGCREGWWVAFRAVELEEAGHGGGRVDVREGIEWSCNR